MNKSSTTLDKNGKCVKQKQRKELAPALKVQSAAVQGHKSDVQGSKFKV